MLNQYQSIYAYTEFNKGLELLLNSVAKKTLEITPDSQMEVAISYYEQAEYDKAKEIFLELAIKKNSKAMNYLVKLSDDKDAFKWSKESAELGNAEGQYNLGFSFLRGRGTEKDKEKCIMWLTKSALQGYAEAQYLLGNCYYEGEDVEEDIDKAEEWLKLAANQEHIEAMRTLRVLYETVEDKEDWNEKSDYWALRIAELREADEYDYYLAGLVYKSRKNYEKAFEWIQKAAEKGHQYAMDSLACFYESGRGVIQNDKKALEWYKKAAATGLQCAKRHLALCYLHGKGTTRDYKQAFEILADHETCDSYDYLGLCYQLGLGVEQSWEKAIEQYKTKDDIFSKCSLARCYLEACFYLDLDIDNSKKEAKRLLEEVIARLEQ